MISVGESHRSSAFDKYIGYANFKVIAINPTQEEFERLFNRKIENWKGYTYKKDNGIENVRLLFVLKDTQPDSKLPLIQMNFFLTRQIRKNQDQTKTQVIDKYGNTAWVTSAEMQNQSIPLSSSGKPLSIIPPYIPCCVGQDKLVSFIKTWSYVPNSHYWDDVNKCFVKKDDDKLKQCQASLDNVKNYWAGDCSEIVDLLKNKDLAEHTITAMLIVRERTIDGKTVQVQDVYDYVIQGNASVTLLEKQFTKDQGRGRYGRGVQFAFTNAFKVNQTAVAPMANAAPNDEYMGMPIEAQPTQAMQAEDEMPF